MKGDTLMGFLDWLALGRDWMLYHIGGYTGLVAFLLLVLVATLGVAHVARWARKWLDGRRERAVEQAEGEQPETALSPALAEIVEQAEMLLQDLYSEEMSE